MEAKRHRGRELNIGDHRETEKESERERKRQREVEIERGRKKANKHFAREAKNRTES